MRVYNSCLQAYNSRGGISLRFAGNSLNVTQEPRLLITIENVQYTGVSFKSLICVHDYFNWLQIFSL